MIVQTIAELAQSYIAHARSSGRLRPSASRALGSHGLPIVGPRYLTARSCIASLLHDQRVRAWSSRRPNRLHRPPLLALPGSSPSTPASVRFVRESLPA